MSGECCFFTFDICSGYHHVLLDPASLDKITFISRVGMFRFKVMPFGNTPDTFQRLMDLLMFGLNLDMSGLSRYHRFLPAHLQRLVKIFEHLCIVNLKPSKCKLLQR